MSQPRIGATVCRLAARHLLRVRAPVVRQAPALLSITSARRQWSCSPHFLHASRLSYTTRAYTAADLTQGDYHKVADHTLEGILDVLETIGDEHDIDGYDVEYSQGVLTLKLGSSGTYVLNKQPPNKQIWLSSPKSGPKRYDYDAASGKWFYARDNHTIDEVLNVELSDILGIDVKLLD